MPHCSSFENEIDGTSRVFKSANRVDNILTELNVTREGRPICYNDNKAVIEFIKGDGVAKGVRHMELRQWYTRLEYKTGKLELEYYPGIKTPADKLTKPGNYTEHKEFAINIQGLNLLGYDYFEDILPLQNSVND